MYVEDNKNTYGDCACYYHLFCVFSLTIVSICSQKKIMPAQVYMAEKEFEQNKFQEALDSDEQYAGLLEIIDSYGGTKTANLAEYYAGVSYLKLGDAEAAIEHLDNFSSVTTSSSISKELWRRFFRIRSRRRSPRMPSKQQIKNK